MSKFNVGDEVAIVSTHRHFGKNTKAVVVATGDNGMVTVVPEDVAAASVKVRENELVLRQSAGQRLYNEMLRRLPAEPTEGCAFFQHGGEILCLTGDDASTIADFLEALGITDCATTGHYDPDEDERNGEADILTGFHYVEF